MPLVSLVRRDRKSIVSASDRRYKDWCVAMRHIHRRNSQLCYDHPLEVGADISGILSMSLARLRLYLIHCIGHLLD